MYVTLTPYNSVGSQLGCGLSARDSLFTRLPPPVGGCTHVFSLRRPTMRLLLGQAIYWTFFSVSAHARTLDVNRQTVLGAGTQGSLDADDGLLKSFSVLPDKGWGVDDILDEAGVSTCSAIASAFVDYDVGNRGGCLADQPVSRRYLLPHTT